MQVHKQQDAPPPGQQFIFNGQAVT